MTLELAAATPPFYRRPIRCACAFSANDIPAPERSRPACSSNAGTPVVPARPLRGVPACKPLLAKLLADGPKTPPTDRIQLPACGPRADSIATAVITDARATVVAVTHPAVVNMRKIPAFDSIHLAVVIKPVVVPVTTVVAVTGVTKSVVNPSVETDGIAPVAPVPAVAVAVIIVTPITRCPHGTDKRCRHPGSGHPVVTISRVPGPVAGRPDVARSRAGRLRVNGQRRWAETDVDSHAHPCG